MYDATWVAANRGGADSDGTALAAVLALVVVLAVLAALALFEAFVPPFFEHQVLPAALLPLLVAFVVALVVSPFVGISTASRGPAATWSAHGRTRRARFLSAGGQARTRTLRA